MAQYFLIRETEAQGAALWSEKNVWLFATGKQVVENKLFSLGARAILYAL